MWCNSVLDYYDYTADDATLTSLAPWIEKRLDYAAKVAAANGSITLRWSRDDDRMGFGFESPDRPEAFRAFRALIVEASSRYATVIEARGTNASAVAKYTALAVMLTQQARSSGPNWYKEYGPHASADAINAGMVTANEAEDILENGALSDPVQLTSLSNFESYFLLKAFASINASSQALYLVHRHWDGMMALGATTTWERYDPQWHDAGCLPVDYPPINAMNSDTSMAHPWASGATAWLSAHGLGVHPVTPGFAEWDAVPLILGKPKVRWVSGSVPTPHGVIHFSANLSAGMYTIFVPTGTVARRVGVPMLDRGRTLSSIRHETDGRGTARQVEGSYRAAQTLFSGGAVLKGARQFSVTTDAAMVYVERLPAGRHLLAIRYSAGPGRQDAGVNSKQFPDKEVQADTARWNDAAPNMTYAAKLVSTDRLSAGDWIGKYGTAGYVLFNYTAAGPVSALDSVPRYITDPVENRFQNVKPPPHPNRPLFFDRVQLPPFVTGVWAAGRVPLTGGPPFPVGGRACGPGMRVCPVLWEQSSQNRRALQDPSRPEGRRTAAAVTSNGWASFHVDIATSKGAPAYNVTLYMVDYTDARIRQAIKVRDGQNLKTIGKLTDFGRIYCETSLTSMPLCEGTQSLTLPQTGY